MAIDGVNTRMNALQFSNVLSRSRNVETSGNASSDAPASNRHAFPLLRPAQPAPADRRAAELPPVAFHWSYRPVRLNGKPAAKRVPQFADSAYWSHALNHLG